ncbi:MAG: hypothetical protein JO256_06255 [Alphaproteobacteria bacterium]|nr:hypothetical protein [Alphaproteobacteria bacterium]
MKFLSDPRLYHNVGYCLEYAKNIAADVSEPCVRLIFHFYWHGPFGRKQAFALKSFLVSQNLDMCEIWLWLDVACKHASSSPYLEDLSRWITIRNYDPAIEAKGTPLDGTPNLTELEEPVSRSDAFRLIALFRHGGVYMDIDTLFLRDFMPLMSSYDHAPFVYRWSAHCPYFSNALIYNPAGHPLAGQLMAHCRRVGSCHSRIAFRHEDHADKDLLELPCGFFDPLWPQVDRKDHFSGAPFQKFQDFFRPFGPFYRQRPDIRRIEDFFPGAFAYQWHGCWRAPEAENSYFGLFERQIEEKFRQKLPTIR